MSSPYLDLRRRLATRDRSLHEKVTSLEAAAALVKDGETVGIGGSTLSRTPMAMIWSLIRARRRNLTCARGITSSEGDWLLGSGACSHAITSWFSQGIVWGISKVMRHYVENGLARFDEWSHMAMGMRFRAGAMGVPFLPMRSMLGSDVLQQRPEVRELDCPYTGERLLLVPALNPDVALIHVQRCDPYGCAPHECSNAYEPFFRHMDQYTALVNGDPVKGMQEYLERYVYGPRSWTDYLNLLGLEHLLTAAHGGRSVSNA